MLASREEGHSQPRRWPNYLAHVFSILSMLNVLACASTTDNSREPPTIRDSSGVRVVDNHVDAWSATGVLEMSERPVLQFALAVEALPAAIGAAARLANRGFVVVTPEDQVIHWLDSLGREQYRAGREGRGPGEFVRIQKVFIVPGDTVVVFDNAQRKLSYYSAAGRLIREVRHTTDVTGASVRAHTIVAATPGGGYFATGSNAPPADGLVRGKSVLVRYDSPGSGVMLGDAYPGTDMYYQPAGKSGFAFFAPPNGRSLAWAGIGDLLVAAHNETFEVRWLNADGAVVRIARAPQGNRAVTEAVQDEIIRDLRRLNPQARPDAEARWRAEQFMYKTVPAFGEMVVGADGRIWLRMDPPAPGTQTARWAVLDSDGTLIGALELARELRLAWAGAQDVLLVRSDTLRGGDSLFVYSISVK